MTNEHKHDWKVSSLERVQRRECQICGRTEQKRLGLDPLREQGWEFVPPRVEPIKGKSA